MPLSAATELPVREGEARHRGPVEQPQAPVGQPLGEALPGEREPQGKSHTEDRSASPPEYPHGILDKSAYCCHEPNGVLGQNSIRILLHPAPLLKPPSMST